MRSVKKYCLGIRDSLGSSWELKKFILQSSKNFSKMVRFILGYENNLSMPILHLINISGNIEWICD